MEEGTRSDKIVCTTTQQKRLNNIIDVYIIL